MLQPGQGAHLFFFAVCSQSFAFPGRGEGWQPPAKPTKANIESYKSKAAQGTASSLLHLHSCLSSAFMGCETLLDLALKGLQQEKVGQMLGLGKGRDLQGPLHPARPTSSAPARPLTCSQPELPSLQLLWVTSRSRCCHPSA